MCKACGEEYVDRTQLHNHGWQGGSLNMLRASVEVVEVCTSSGLPARAVLIRSTLGVERKKNSGCSRVDGTGIQDPRATGKRDCGRGGWGKSGQKRRVAVAVSCCLEMALWKTLWMAGQVSRMASGGGGERRGEEVLSASFMRLLMNFSGVESRAVVSRMKGTRLTCGYRSNFGQEDLLGRRLDAKETVRHWMVGYQSVSSLPDGGRHRKAQARPLSGMARSEERYSGSLQEMIAKGENVKERMDMAKRYSCAPSQ